MPNFDILMGIMYREVKGDVVGIVQGVFFRVSTKEQADKLGIKGWVKNNKNGSVSFCVQGAHSDIDSMLDWLKEGPEQSVVTALKITGDESVSLLFESFDIYPT